MPEGALPHRPPPCCATSQGRCQWQQSMAARPELGELPEPVPQGLSAPHNSKHTLGLQLQPGRTRPRPPHSPELLFLAFLEPAVPQQPASVQPGLPKPTQHSQAAVPQGDLLAPGHPGMSIHSVLLLPAPAELIWAHRDVCPLCAAIPEPLPIVTELPYPRCTSTSQ